jgi:hypothetical protein
MHTQFLPLFSQQLSDIGYRFYLTLSRAVSGIYVGCFEEGV